MSIYSEPASLFDTASQYSYVLQPETLPDDELEHVVDSMIVHNRWKFLENEVIESYIRRMQPNLLVGIQQRLDIMRAIRARKQVFANMTARRITTSFRSQTSGITTPTTGMHRDSQSMAFPRRGSSFVGHRPVRVMKISKKMAMVSRELEVARERNIIFSAKLKNARTKYAETASGLTTEKNIYREMKVDFLAKVVDLLDSLSPKAAYDKYMKYFDQCFRRIDFEVNKLRLMQGPMSAAITSKKALLEEKREFGEALKPVDFEIIEREHSTLANKLETNKNILVDLRISCSFAVTEKTAAKHFFDEQMEELKEIESKLKAKVDETDRKLARAGIIKLEIEESTVRLETLQDMRRRCEVPDTLDYLRLKEEISQLKKEVKTWTRRRDTQHRSLMLKAGKLRKLQREKRRGNKLLN